MNGKERRLAAGQKLEQARHNLANVILEAKAIIAQDSDNGVPDAVIARDLGVSRTTVRQWLGK